MDFSVSFSMRASKDALVLRIFEECDPDEQYPSSFFRKLLLFVERELRTS